MTTALEDALTEAETRWLDRWIAGPTEAAGSRLPTGAPAPDLTVVDHAGDQRRLSEFWAAGPALLMFWRHFGCSCGVERAGRLKDEWASYLDAGLTPVIVAQGDPVRAAAYRTQHDLPGPILCDPDHVVYTAYGVGHWPVERVLFDAPAEYWSHPRDLGQRLQGARREQGRPLVDDPWRAVAEFVISAPGTVRLCYSYQYCADYPDPRVLTTAARLR